MAKPSDSPSPDVPPPYPVKAVSERALGPSDLDALRSALHEDLRQLLGTELSHQVVQQTLKAHNAVQGFQGVHNALEDVPPAPGWNLVSPPMVGHTKFARSTSDSTAPLDGMALIICDQARTALRYLDTLERGPADEVPAATPPPPIGIRRRLEIAHDLLDQIENRLAQIVSQVGSI